MRRRNFLGSRATRIALIASVGFIALFTRCSEEIEPEPYRILELTASAASTCGCTYVVPYSSGTVTIDGSKLGIKPGNVICFEGNKTWGNVVLKNIRGSSTAPVTIKNCGGTVTLTGTGKPFGIRTETSSYFKITGGTSGYGIKVNGGHISVTFDKLTTNVEMDHVEVYNSGFAGIMAKTDPACDLLAIRGKFTMRDVILHDNYVHNTGGEGMYVGNTSWLGGINASCGKLYPHEVAGVKIYNNLVKETGWDGIQVGSAPNGAEVYNNRIENYGTKNAANQNNGIQFGEGATGKCYGNFIKSGKGHGIIIIGNGKNLVHDNVIINAGIDGIFCDDRVTGEGFVFTNNTIIRPAMNGIRLYADQVTMNKIQNNIIIAPGNYNKLVYPRKKEEAYVYLLSKYVKLTTLNNYYSQDINAPKFVAYSSDNYALTSSSAVCLNKGTSISTWPIPVDHALKTRVKAPFDEVLDRIPPALQREGFGILTEIDVQGTLKKKLDVDFRRYRILGACRPASAHRVLERDADMGVLLPCNVALYEDGEDTVVLAVDPMAMIGDATRNLDIQEVAADIHARLRRVLDSLG